MMLLHYTYMYSTLSSDVLHENIPSFLVIIECIKSIVIAFKDLYGKHRNFSTV